MNAIQAAWAWVTQAQQWHGTDGIPARLIQHLEYTGIALVLAALIALPLGLLIGHTGRGSFLVVSLANFGRALPTLGLVILAFLLTNGSSAAVLVALVVLAIPPILVNTYEGVRGVDRDVKDAAKGMGMTAPQVLLRAEIPIATPLIMLGLRTAAIQVVATATIAAYIGLGGLGRYIIDGLARSDYAMVGGGAIVVVALALAVQVLFIGARRLAVPTGLREQAQTS
ncbi:MAG TPA: ABC transporter permease [Streptosporangiaceae bacterium]|nr:ABC transporter permease [Streptosporangiaceae bacterium]